MRRLASLGIAVLACWLGVAALSQRGIDPRFTELARASLSTIDGTLPLPGGMVTGTRLSLV